MGLGVTSVHILETYITSSHSRIDGVTEDTQIQEVINKTDGPLRNLTIVAAFVYQIQSRKDAGPITYLNGLRNLTIVAAFVYQI